MLSLRNQVLRQEGVNSVPYQGGIKGSYHGGMKETYQKGRRRLIRRGGGLSWG